MSYSWYVIHWPVILILTADRTGLDTWLLLIVKLVATAGAAAVLHLTIEQPLRRLERPTTTIVAVWLTASVLIVAGATLIV